MVMVMVMVGKGKEKSKTTSVCNEGGLCMWEEKKYRVQLVVRVKRKGRNWVRNRGFMLEVALTGATGTGKNKAAKGSRLPFATCLVR